MMHHDTDDYLTKALQERRAANAFRELHQRNTLVDFSSNDYLGLAHAGLLAQAVETQLTSIATSSQHYGSGGSRLLAGNSAYAEALEQDLAQFFKGDAALIYNSGYTANLGFFSCVPQRTDTIVYDGLIHASIRDGIRLSHARAWSFAHNDLKELESLLQKATGTIYVAVESIYSMDGDAAPLAELVALCARYGARLVVDEAHGVGVFGARGEGLAVALSVESGIFARLVTFGKAAGCHGAAWVGSEVLRNYLINFSRPFIYTTALPLHDLLVIRCSLEVMANAQIQRDALQKNIRCFKNLASTAQLTTVPSESAIQALLISGNTNVKKVAEKAVAAGFDLRPVLSPTVPQGEERIRICIHAYNSLEELTRLFDVLHIER